MARPDGCITARGRKMVRLFNFKKIVVTEGVVKGSTVQQEHLVLLVLEQRRQKLNVVLDQGVLRSFIRDL